MSALEDMLFGSWEDLIEDPAGVTCRHCGAKKLWWFPEKRQRYLLKNPDGTQHNCQHVREPANVDEFDDLS